MARFFQEFSYMPTPNPLAFYAAHGLMTDPREQAALLETLPADLSGLSHVVQGLLMHPFETELYQVELSKVQRKEVNIRPAAEMLRQIHSLDPRPLTEARPPAERLTGNCRDHAVLFCAMLRQQGIPARVRVGFAAYLGPDLNYNHWITEVWDAVGQRWRMVDAQLDEPQRKKHKVTFDTLDLPPGQFFTAAQTWAQCRAGKLKTGKYGHSRKLRGWNYIRTSLLQELAALNKVEVLPWDIWWDLATKDDTALTLEERKLLDQAAALINNLDESFSDMTTLYEADPRLGAPVASKLKLLGLMGESGGGMTLEDSAARAVAAAKSLELQPSDRERLALLSRRPAPGPGGNCSASHLPAAFALEDSDLPSPGGDPDLIVVRGAQMHNLKHVNVIIPRNQFVVLTGVSGSGKSSLAFDTLYAEGQRRYVESLSAYVRRYLDQMDKPKVDMISGLSPAISIEQKSVSKNPRSTVGTVTEVMDYLRVLFSRAGTQHCPQCGRAIEPTSPQQAADSLAQLPAGTRFQLIAPLLRNRKGDPAALLEAARRDGFTRARVDGSLIELLEGAKLPKWLKSQPHTVELVVDRLVAPEEGGTPLERRDYTARLIDSVETCLRAGKGLLQVDLGGGEELLLSEQNVCPHCEITLAALSPALFTFNAPSGMCPECNGLGTKLEIQG
jgi:excinuclease ABC subunit A